MTPTEYAHHLADLTPPITREQAQRAARILAGVERGVSPLGMAEEPCGECGSEVKLVLIDGTPSVGGVSPKLEVRRCTNAECVIYNPSSPRYKRAP